ncbi:MAG: response regulator [Candidatus Rokubacteria bacterium]|nr:response regulator [Candidatus Rokubacteria bacterium]
METARILVVDDEPGVCEVLKEFLETRGYQVTTAASGAEALKAVQAERPHLVLLDILMPGMNGLEALPRILEIDRTIGVMMLTAVDDYQIVKQAIGKGAYDYITKPINFDYLELSILTRLAQTDLPLRGFRG